MTSAIPQQRCHLLVTFYRPVYQSELELPTFGIVVARPTSTLGPVSKDGEAAIVFLRLKRQGVNDRLLRGGRHRVDEFEPIPGPKISPGIYEPDDEALGDLRDGRAVARSQRVNQGGLQATSDAGLELQAAIFGEHGTVNRLLGGEALGLTDPSGEEQRQQSPWTLPRLNAARKRRRSQPPRPVGDRGPPAVRRLGWRSMRSTNTSTASSLKAS